MGYGVSLTGDLPVVRLNASVLLGAGGSLSSSARLMLTSRAKATTPSPEPYSASGGCPPDRRGKPMSCATGRSAWCAPDST
jgi:hypothetical protein